MLLLTNCNLVGEQEVIVTPKNFKGYILVIYNQEHGSPVKYIGRKRLYEIPQNGILKTQFKINTGWHELTEFYSEKIAPENKLKSLITIDSIPTDTIVGFIGPNGTVRKNSTSEYRIEFCEYFIGDKSDIEVAREQIQKLDIAELGE